MGAFLFIVIVFIVCVGGGYYVFTGVFDSIFGKRESKGGDYIDNTTHIYHNHHYHDNRTINVDGEEFKNSLKK